MSGAWLKDKFNLREAQSTAATLDPPLTRHYGSPMDIPLIEQIKIQAQVLVPLVKTLQAELGEERANAIVRQALGNLYRNLGEREHPSETSHVWANRQE